MAIRFDNTGEYLRRAGPGAQSAYTLAGWFLLDVDLNAQQTLLGGLDTGFAAAASLGTASNGTTPMATSTGGSASGTDVGTGVWMYLAMTRSSDGTSRFYQGSRNAAFLTEITPGSAFPAIGSGWDLILASAFGLTNQLNGRAAYNRVWTTDLSKTQLEAEMRATSAVVTSNLWADYPFTSDANDASGNGRNWTVTGTVSYVDQPPLDMEPEIGVWEDVTPFAIEDGFGFQCIAVDASGNVFGTYDYNGLYRSTDQGDNWSKRSSDTDLDNGTPWTLQPDPTDASKMWANSGAGGGGGPLLSTDGGVAWTLKGAGSPTQLNDIYCIAIDPDDPDHLLVTWHSLWSGDVSSGVSESFNGGDTWTNHAAGDASWGTGHAVFFTPGGAWLVATQDAGIWRSDDSGATWDQVETTSMTHGATQCLTAVGTTLFLALEHGIATSTDDGETWTDINTGLDTGLYYSCVATDGTNLFTGGSFPIEGDYGTIGWYTRPITSGSWTLLQQSPAAVNGPRQWATDGTHLYTANYHGGVWRFTPTATEPTVAEVDPCVLTLAPVQPAIAASSAVAVAVGPAALTLASVQPTIAASSAAAVTIGPCALTLTPVQPSVAAAGTAAIAVASAALTLACVEPTLSGAGTITAQVDTCEITLTPVEVTLTPASAVSVAVDPCTLTVDPVEPSLSATGVAGAAVDSCALTLTGVDVEATTGADVVELEACELELAPIEPTLAATGTATVAVDPCELTLSCGEIVTGGTTLAELDPCSLTLTCVEPSLAGAGTAVVAVDPCEFALAPVEVTATPSSAAPAAVDRCELTVAGVDVVLVGSAAASVTIEPAALTLTCVEVEAIVATFDPPEARTFVVQAEQRFVVPAVERLVTVAPEPRTWRVSP